MKQVIPEIYIKDCLSALDFYKATFGGQVKNLQMSDDNQMFSDIKGKVIHSELHVNSECVFYFVDALSPQRKNGGNVTLMLHMDDENEISKAYEALKTRGTVLMPLQNTFWGAKHAIVTDEYGAPWALNCSSGQN